MPRPEPALVVDDDPAVARLVGAFLTRIGLEVTIAGSRQEAEAQLAAGTGWRLMITDLQLGGEEAAEGLQILARCRELSPDCRRILISGSVAADMAADARGFGADLFLAKPITLAELTAAVRSLLPV